MKSFLPFPILLTLCILFSCKSEESPSRAIKKVSTQGENNLLLQPLDAEGKYNIYIPNAPSAITRNIIEDSKGNIWFATFEGVIKYDGEAFFNMTKEVSQSRFFSILEDSKGDIWMGSIGSGVYRYDGSDFQNFTTSDGLVGDRVTNIYEDTKGRIWFGAVEGISCYTNGTFRNFTKEDGLTDNDVNSIIEDEEGVFWIGTRGSACTYDGKSFTKITTPEGQVFTNIRHIIKDRKGQMWLGGNDGLWSYDGKKFKNFTRDFTGYIYEDSKGNILTSSDSSLSAGWALTNYPAASLSLEKSIGLELKTGEGMFFGISEDSKGNIWVGTLNGVYRYDGKTFEDFRNS